MDNVLNLDQVTKDLGEWKEMAARPVGFEVDAFWNTMEKWALNPTHMNKSQKSFTLLSKESFDSLNNQIINYKFPENINGSFVLNSNSNNNNNTSGDVSTDKDKVDEFLVDDEEVSAEYIDGKHSLISYKRNLIPRMLDKDAILEEQVIHRLNYNESIFLPKIPDMNNARSLPFHYPKLYAMKFTYEPIDQIKDKDLIDKFKEEDELQLKLNTKTKNKQKQQQQKNKKRKGQDEEEEEEDHNCDNCDNDDTTEITYKAIIKFKVIEFKNFTYNFDKYSKDLLNKIKKWSNTYETGYKKLGEYDKIFPKHMFLSLYRELKEKHKNIAVGWKEVSATDPQKYVFEDIALATYIICLWRLENQEKGITKPQTFIDLGCGNGLLVNLLNKEGYHGIGVDLKSRRVWKHYDEGVQKNLYEKIVLPQDMTYPEYDWIIGNHSDELTPWIPYIASKSPGQRFFLLPCCFYTFSGGKFNANDPKIGRYKTYLNFVESIMTELGFKVVKENLRIPSTKNIAFVTRSNDQLENIDQIRKSILEKSKYTIFTPRKPIQAWTPQKRYKSAEENPHLKDKLIDNNNNNNNEEDISKNNNDTTK